MKVLLLAMFKVCLCRVLVFLFLTVSFSYAGDGSIKGLKIDFFGGEYAKVLKSSNLAEYKKGSEDYGDCLFLMGGSYFYLGKYGDAAPLLDEHIKGYPQSKFMMHSKYIQASNLARLSKWQEAGDKLADFMEEHKDPKTNIYFAQALYDRANCAYAMENYEYAIKLLKRIEKDFFNSSVVDMSYALRGNIEESLGRYDVAENYYVKALKTAEENGHRSVAGESLNYLIGMLGAQYRGQRTNPRMKDAVPYFDKMWKEHQDSPYLVQAVVFARPAMKLVRRGDEVMEKLRKVIGKLAMEKNPPLLEECVNAHTRFFLEDGGTLEEMEKLYATFKANMRVLLVLKVSLLDAYESRLNQRKAVGGAETVRWKKRIGELYKELAKHKRLEDLSNYALLKVGMHLRESSDKKPKVGLNYFQQVLENEDSFGEFKAMQFVGEILGESGLVEDQEKGLTILGQLYERAHGDVRVREKVLRTEARVLNNMGRWAQLEVVTRKYIEARYSRYGTEMGYLFARSFDKRNKAEDALFYYGTVYQRYMGHLEFSTLAIKRMMELLWARNKPVGAAIGKKKMILEKSDRQSAYEVGQSYIRATRRIRKMNPQVTEGEKKSWDAVERLVKKYEASGLVEKLPLE